MNSRPHKGAIIKITPMNRYTIIIILITLAVTTTMLTSFLSYRNAGRAADDFLRAQALGIAASLDTTLARYGTGDNIFKDIIKSEQWEGIAYLALYGEDGTVVLHSNKNMIGRKSGDTAIRDALASGKTHFSYRTLGTGEDVFIMDTALHFGTHEKILRVALHTYPSRKIIRQSRLQLWSAVGVAVILSLLTVVLLISMKKREDLGRALVEKEKLSVLGEMAAALAHEIRNPLGSIKGFAQYLRERCAGQDYAGEEAGCLDVIVSESGRIERLTEDLLSYSRKDAVRLGTFRLSELLRELLSSLSLPVSVSVKDLVDDALVLTSDREKLRQVFANLIQNSLDAISGNGVVTIRGKKEGRMAMLSVEDTGAGIDEQTMQNIFRPFFTTKAKGTGLGLAIADRYVRLLGGSICVESVVGKGSTFTFVIPREMPVAVAGRT